MSVTYDAWGGAFWLGTVRVGGVEASVSAMFAQTDTSHPKPHSGTDFAFSWDGAVPCFRDITVTHVDVAGVGFGAVFGNCLRGQHADGTRVLYAHLRDPLAWSVGDTIREGETVGVQGNTGRSDGQHLHLGMAPADNPDFLKDADGGVSRLIDPLVYMTAPVPLPQGEFLPEPVEARDLGQIAADLVYGVKQGRVNLIEHGPAPVGGGWQRLVVDYLP